MTNPEKSERERLAQYLWTQDMSIEYSYWLADWVIAREARLREALEFIANQKDKAGNWAVEIAKRTLDEISKEVK